MNHLASQEKIMSSWSGAREPLVSICCITYNHEAYIEAALKGFLIQQTTFPFEILIHDDASTDRTADIIREYESKYPLIIKPIYQIENQYSKGKRITAEFNLPRSNAQFVALCEGDDYWTDKTKLQKQVLFLQHNIEYSMCSHGVDFEFDGVHEHRKNYESKPIIDANFEQILNRGIFIALNSIVFRKECLMPVPLWLYKLPGWHKALIYILSSKGKNRHFDDVMAVKRRNPGGVTIQYKKERKETYYERNIYLLENLKTEISSNYSKAIDKKLRSLYVRQSLSFVFQLQIRSFIKSIISAAMIPK